MLEWKGWLAPSKGRGCHSWLAGGLHGCGRVEAGLL